MGNIKLNLGKLKIYNGTRGPVHITVRLIREITC